MSRIRAGVAAAASLLLALTSGEAGYRTIKVKRAALGEALKGSNVAGFDLGRDLHDYQSDGEGVTSAHKGTKTGPEGWGETIEYAPSSEIGTANRIYIEARWHGHTIPTAVFFSPNWPEGKGPQDWAEQAKLAGLKVAEFEGWTEHFGAIHRTQRPDVYVGLTASADDATPRLGWIIRLLPDRLDEVPTGSKTNRELLFEEQLGAISRLPYVKDVLDAAIAKGDTAAIRAALPRPIPVGGAADELLAKQQAALATRTAPIPESFEHATTLSDAIIALGQVAAAVESAGGRGADLPLERRQELARAVQNFAKGRRVEAAAKTVPAARGVLETLAAEAEASVKAVEANGDISVLRRRAEDLKWVITGLESGQEDGLAFAWVRLHAVAADAPPPTAARLIDIARAEQPRVVAAAESSARDEESRGLPATAAAHWLLAEALDRGAMGLAPASSMASWFTPVSADDTRRSRARRLVAPLGAALIPSLADAPSFQVLSAHLGEAWVSRTLFGLAFGTDEQHTASAGQCRSSWGPVVYDGTYTVRDTRKKVSGKMVTRTLDASDVTAWSQKVATAESTVASLERQAQPSSAPLGTEVKGAAAVTRSVVGANGEYVEETLSGQNTYRIGVGKDAKAQRERMEDAKARLPGERALLESLRRNPPVPGTVVNEWQTFGGQERYVQVEWQEWQGIASRRISADCGHEGDSDRIRIDAKFDADKLSEEGSIRSERISGTRGVNGADTFKSVSEFAGAVDRVTGWWDYPGRAAILDRLLQETINVRIADWRDGAASALPQAPKDDLDREADWRRWLFSSDPESAPGTIPLLR